MTKYDKKTEFDTQVKKHLIALKKACIKNDIPFFFAAAIKNDNSKTEYVKEIYSGMAANKELKEDFFPEFMKVTLGLKADIKRPEEKFVLLDDDEN